MCQIFNILQEIRAPNNFSLYDSSDNGIIIPNQKYGILLIVDRSIIGVQTLLKLNIGNQCNYLFVPNEVQLYGKQFKFNESLYNPSTLKGKYLEIIHDLHPLDKSCMFDITPYISFLFSKFNIQQYPLETFKFINSIINNAIATIENKDAIKRWIILHVLDNSLLPYDLVDSTKIYAYMYLNTLKNGGQGILGNNINEIYLYHINDTNQHNICKIYDKDEAINFDKVVEIFDTYIPGINIQQNKKKIEEKKDDKGSIIPNKKVERIEKKKEKGIDISKKEIDDLKTLLNFARQDYSEEFTNDQKNNKEETIISNPIITKINEEEYNYNREIPIIDHDEVELNQNNNKMFPFLNSTKIKDDNLTDIDYDNVKNDNSDKLKEMLDKIVPQLVNKKEKEKELYEILQSKLLRNPNLLEKSYNAFIKNDIHQLMVYFNNEHLPYSSRIYPKKDEVDRKILDDMDNWAKEHDAITSADSDRLLNSQVISSVFPTNIHRVIAQKQLTWDRMPQEIEKFIKKPLENNGFQCVGVTMVDKEPPITQIEPTYHTEIRIKVRNTKTKAGQTLVFNVPTLIDGKYHISGGLKWLFPNVIATLPIFITKPGKVQFRTNYTAVTFNHHSTQKVDRVSVYVDNINMPLVVWLLQHKSLSEISKNLGFKIILYDDKKDAKSHDLIVTLPDKVKIAGIDIIESKNAKLIKGLCYDLQMLCNKLTRYGYVFDIYSIDDAEFIQLYAPSNKKNIQYDFSQIKNYIIDMRTEEILSARGIEPNIYDVSVRCAQLSINDIVEERLSINNINIRLMDLIPTQVEKGIHAAIADYKRRRLQDPDAKLVVNSAWVTNELMKQSVLQPYKDGNLTIELAQLTGVRLVGPGGFRNNDMLMTKDRSVVGDHFGSIDPVDTSEGNPGAQLSLTLGFEYDPKHGIFSQVRSNNSYKMLFGTSVSQVPFSANDDGNRLEYGGSQGRQVVPIDNSEAPLVGTGMEAYLPSYASNKFVKRSPIDGKVVYIDKNIIIIKDNNNHSYQVDIRPSMLTTGSEKANGLTHTPCVKTGDMVKKGQYLATNQFIKPVYCAGANVLACYKPESGYTFEDGIVVSESFAKRYTSLHYKKIDIKLNYVNELIEFPLFKLQKDGNMTYEPGETIVKLQQNAFGGFNTKETIADTHCQVVDIKIYPGNQKVA